MEKEDYRSINGGRVKDGVMEVEKREGSADCKGLRIGMVEEMAGLIVGRTQVKGVSVDLLATY